MYKWTIQSPINLLHLTFNNLTKKHNLVSYFCSNVTIICHSPYTLKMKMKWNESGFRPLLCTYRLNWARRTSWGWWDDWDDTVLLTQDSKFEPWRSEAEHATSRSRRLPTVLTFTRGWGRNIFCFFQTAVTGNRTPNSGVKGSGANHYPRAPAPGWYGSFWRVALPPPPNCKWYSPGGRPHHPPISRPTRVVSPSNDRMISMQTQNIYITFIQCWTNVEDWIRSHVHLQI